MNQLLLVCVILFIAVVIIIFYLSFFVKEFKKFLDNKKFITKISTNCSSLVEKYDLCQSVIKPKSFLKKSNSDDGALEKKQGIEIVDYSHNNDTFITKDQLSNDKSINDNKLSKVRDIAIKVWTAINIYYNSIIENAQPTDAICKIVFQSEKRNTFIDTFCDYYFSIIEKYMQKDVNSLDGHKQTAIIIAILLEEEIFTINKEDIPVGSIFLGSQVMALSVGLGYMQTILNNRLEKYGYNIDCYTMPRPFSCETDYFDVLCRSLYIEMDETKKINILTLANTLFLIECVTLQAKNIDLSVLEHGNKEKINK